MSIKNGESLKKVALVIQDDLKVIPNVDVNIKKIRAKLNSSPSSCKRQALMLVKSLENIDDALKIARKACNEFLQSINENEARINAINADELLRKNIENAENIRRSKKPNRKITQK